MSNGGDSPESLTSLSLSSRNFFIPQPYFLVYFFCLSKSPVFESTFTYCLFVNLPLISLLLSTPTIQNVYVNINRIMSVGNRLLESGHYASQQIKQISGQLEQEWKAFAAALDERSTLLEMSASFHQKCDQVSHTHTNTHTYRNAHRCLDLQCKYGSARM